MEKENKLSRVSNRDIINLSFQDSIDIVDAFSDIHQCLIFLKNIAQHGSTEQVANVSFSVFYRYTDDENDEKYILTDEEYNLLYDLSIMMMGEEGEFDIPKGDIIQKIDSLIRNRYK